MKIATTIGEMYSYFSTPAEAVRSYAGTGFKYLDYSFYYDHKEPSPFMLDDDRFWKQQIEDSMAAADECGFSFVQAHAPGYNPLGAACDSDRCMRAMVRSITACGMMKIPTIVVHTSFNPKHVYPVDKDAYFQYNLRFLQPLLAEAEKYSVTVCIENTATRNMGVCYFPRTAAEMNDMVAFVNHPLLGCCWDTGHAIMEGKNDQYDDLMELGSNLKAVHIHDNNGLSDQHLPPYCGGRLQLDRLVAALKDMKFAGCFTFESENFLNKCAGTGPLAQLPLDLRRATLSILYSIGSNALKAYGIEEDR